MAIGVLTVRLAIYESTSLKDKRRVLKSIKDRVRNKFNASIAETDALNSRQSAVITVAVVSNDPKFSQGCLQKVLNCISGHHGSTLVDYEFDAF